MQVDDTSQPNDQCIAVDRFLYLALKEEYVGIQVKETIENVQVGGIVVNDDQCVSSAMKEDNDSHPLQEEEFLDEYLLMLQKEILENELQEVSSIIIEEDKQKDTLNGELQDITSKPKHIEQFEGALKDIIIMMLFKGALKNIMKYKRNRYQNF